MSYLSAEIKPVLDLCVVSPLLRTLVNQVDHCNSALLHLNVDAFLFMVLTLAPITLTGDASPLFEGCFVRAIGPLLWAIPVWKNSLVCHDLTKLTSISIHYLPAMVVCCIRWRWQDVELTDRLDLVSWIVYPPGFYWF